MTSEKPPSIILRPCAETDIPAITEIYREAVLYGSASFELEPPSIDDMQTRRRTLMAGNFPYIIAEIDGVLAGYAYAGAWRARPAYKATVEDSIYVNPLFQARGIGRMLLDALMTECTQRGFRQMIAVIGDSANLGSVAVHRAAGFEMTGTLKSVGWKHGRWLDTVLMQRALGEGDETPRQ